MVTSSVNVMSGVEESFLPHTPEVSSRFMDMPLTTVLGRIGDDDDDEDLDDEDFDEDDDDFDEEIEEIEEVVEEDEDFDAESIVEELIQEFAEELDLSDEQQVELFEEMKKRLLTPQDQKNLP